MKLLPHDTLKDSHMYWFYRVGATVSSPLREGNIGMAWGVRLMYVMECPGTTNELNQSYENRKEHIQDRRVRLRHPRQASDPIQVNITSIANTKQEIPVISMSIQQVGCLNSALIKKTKMSDPKSQFQVSCH